MKLFGGIEAGGTKFICAVGTGPDEMLKHIQIHTTSPKETLEKVIIFFKKYHQKKQLKAIGIGSFGPIDMDKKSASFGKIVSTPKSGWNNTDILGTVQSAFNIPVVLDTDVNASALGEHLWGAAQGLNDFIYLTIGTGIGGGGMVNGNLLHGRVHPEMGHIYIPHDLKRDPFRGICPFHGDCFEGLASGTAMQKRWGKKPENLEENLEVWSLEAHYISLALSNYTYTFSPEKIIIGGGVTRHPRLIGIIHDNVIDYLNNYPYDSEFNKNIKEYIVLPALGNRSGVLGAIALAKQKIQR
jgi:fructokinase